MKSETDNEYVLSNVKDTQHLSEIKTVPRQVPSSKALDPWGERKKTQVPGEQTWLQGPAKWVGISLLLLTTQRTVVRLCLSAGLRFLLGEMGTEQAENHTVCCPNHENDQSQEQEARTDLSSYLDTNRAS